MRGGIIAEILELEDAYRARHQERSVEIGKAKPPFSFQTGEEFICH